MKLTLPEIQTLQQGLTMLCDTKVKPFTVAISIGENIECITSKLEKINKEQTKIQKDFFKVKESGDLLVGDNNELIPIDDKSMELFAVEHKKFLETEYPIELQMIPEKSIKNAYETTDNKITPAVLFMIKKLIDKKAE